MEKIYKILAALGITITVTVAPAFAQATAPTKILYQTNTAQTTNLATKQATLKERADLEITRRTTSMTNLIARINAMKKVSQDQKITLTTQIQTEITNLTTLKAKIDAETDQTMLKTDVQSIVSSYRIFAIFMPKVEIIAASDRLLATADNMSSIAAKLQTRITEAQAKGIDVTSLSASMTDIQAEIQDSKTQASNAILTVMPLTPDGFPANKTTLQSARQMVVTGIHDLNTARQDMRSILEFLRNGKTPLKVSTPTATGASKVTTPGL